MRGQAGTADKDDKSMSGVKKLPLRVLPHLWAILRTCLQEDGGHVEDGDALAALCKIAQLLKLRRSLIRKQCNFSRGGAHAQLLARLTAEAVEFRKHVGDDGELDGEESDDVSVSREWLEQPHGPGSTLSPQDATRLHQYVTRELASDGHESDDEDSSYVVHEGPVHAVVQAIRGFPPQ